VSFELRFVHTASSQIYQYHIAIGTDRMHCPCSVLADAVETRF
jgi:hypothetical protein